MGRKNVSMKDIAAELNVSIVTVSKALSDKEGVGKQLREQILDTAQRLGYVAKSQASTAPADSRNIAIIISERYLNIQPSFYFDIYQVLLKSLSKRGYVGILEIIKTSDEDTCSCPNVVRMGSVDQVVVMGQMSHDYLEMMTKEDVNLIFFDFDDEELGVDSIVSDNILGGYTLAKYLVKHGKKRIGYVGSIKMTNSILDRYMGYVKYVIKHDLPYDDSWLIEDRNTHGDFIDFQLPPKEKMPDAFICNCDVVANKFVDVLINAGYKVPEDVAVVGYDDFACGENKCGLKLTTYKTDIDMMISICGHIINQRAHSKAYRRGKSVVKGEIIERETV